MVITGISLERLRQRGLKESDLDFIITNGTIKGRTAMLTNKDRARLIEQAKKTISIVTRLSRKQIVVDGDDVITVFHATASQQRRFMAHK